MDTLLRFICRRHHQIIFVSECLAVLTVLWPGYAAAHRVTVFAWVEGETVHTESKFSGGKPVNGGEILVYDLDGNPLLSGKTNEQGEFSFKIPKKTGMKIVLQAGMGHRGEWTLPLSEIAPHEPKPEPAVSQETPAGMSEAGVPASSVSLDQIRRVLDQSLDQRLNPVLKMLSESRDKGPTLRDILGGIGYILGLMGLAAYIHFRRKAGEITGKNKG
jgi:nickel transport protein